MERHTGKSGRTVTRHAVGPQPQLFLIGGLFPRAADQPIGVRVIIEIANGGASVSVQTHMGRHCLHDLITPIFLLPQEVRESCYIVGTNKKHFINELLLMLGFEERQILSCPDNTVFYAENLQSAPLL